MSFEQLLFYVFAFCLIVSACLLIFSRNTVKAALFLVLAFVFAAGLWLLLEAEFLAITLILVYVGAVMVLFLFVIKMLNIDQATQRAKFTAYLPLGLMVAGATIGLMSLFFSRAKFVSDGRYFVHHSSDYSNITVLAEQLYTLYVYPFELAAILLLIAIIAAITLVHRPQIKRKKQNISEQVNVVAKDRMRLISITTNKEK